MDIPNFFQIKTFYQNRDLENFLVEDYFQKINNCNFNQEISIKNLIEERINYNWYLNKYKEVYSNNPNQSSDEERIKKVIIDFLIKETIMS